MTQLVIISAENRAALLAEMKRIADFIDRVHDVSIDDLAFTCAKVKGESVLAIVADDTRAFRDRLASALRRLASPNVERLHDRGGTYYFDRHLIGGERGKLAFVYPGVTSFYPDMMRDIAITFPSCRDAFDELEEAMAGVSDGFAPSSFVFPPAPCYRHDADFFSSGAYAQALVSTYTACMALTRLAKACGIRPDGVVGFAGGDLAAIMRSGAAGEAPSRPDRIRALREIYAIVDKAVDHAGLPEVAMVTVLIRHPEKLDAIIASFPPDKVTLAVDFSPRQKTYAVMNDVADEVLAAFAAADIRAVKLDLNRPFNTELCKSLVPAIRKFADHWMKHDPTCEVYSCATATRIPSRTRAARADVAQRWSKPTRFNETIRKMYDDGYRVFLEVGPRGLMSRAVDDTLKDCDHAAIALNSMHRRGILQLQHAFGLLAAYGAQIDLTDFFDIHRVHTLDFDSTIAGTIRRDSELRLSSRFPRMTLIAPDTLLSGASFLAEPKGRGAKATARAAALAQKERRRRQFGFGAMNPLVSDADLLSSNPGFAMEVVKTFKVSEMPFLADFALGTSQISYSDPNMRGLLTLALPVGAEIMAEVAQQIVPNRLIVAMEELISRRTVVFRKGELRLFVKAERAPSANAGEIAVKVLLRNDAPNGANTWPVMEATFLFAERRGGSVPASVVPHSRPRNVHWSSRDVYPARLSYGKRLRGIRFVEAWSETGLDYEVRVPSGSDSVSFTRFPVWAVNPLLLATVTSGFSLWRSHERFAGAFAFPFRLRRMDFRETFPDEDVSLNCYLRLTGVTPESQICDISVTDGNGQEIASVSGWEERTERVPVGYCNLVLQPAMTFLTQPLDPEFLGSPSVPVASAVIYDMPFEIFERHEELWLKTLSHIILCASEQRDFDESNHSTARRTEWLFGRLAAKEAMRRFLKETYQARWSDADIQIWRDDSGKPHALGAWADYMKDKVDIAIAHTTQFVIALAAANARIGVDVESVNRDVSDTLAEGVFSPDELEIAARSANASQATMRFWCAKEAVSKALGMGIRFSLLEMPITAYQPDTGKITVRLEGKWLETFKMFRGRDIEVVSRVLCDHALAFCFISSSLFD